MNEMNWLQLILFSLVIILLTKPMGLYLCKVLSYKQATAFERSIYKVCGINPLEEQDWKQYLISILGFTFICLIFMGILLAFQNNLPLNPENISAPSWHLNLNTSVSYVTNTDYQSYRGEKAMSYFSQMVALVVQNFVSAAVGLASAAALVRGIAGKGKTTLGNFWRDLVRINLYLLLPISIIAATLFIAEGVPQNFNSYVTVTTLEGDSQTIIGGPIASGQAIKLLGSNGGGYTNANSAHPYENPTPLSNLLQMLLIFLIPAGQIYYFGKTVNSVGHGWFIITALGTVFLLGVITCASSEAAGNPDWQKMGLINGNYEGKESRFGIFDSSLFACVTTAISCGAVNCMHDSLTPMGSLIPFLNIELSEVIFGGVGAGLYSVLLFVFLSIFIAGLIIGRTPEYLGKKIESFDIKMTMLSILPYVLIVHGFTAWSTFSAWGLSALGNSGNHGFSELLYAFSSAGANNGSALAGLSTNAPMFNVTLAIAMFFGRFLVIAPVIALAGSFAQKKIHPKTAASFPVSSLIFTSLLIGIILLIGALTFLPALTMGPIIEQFFMLKGDLF